MSFFGTIFSWIGKFFAFIRGFVGTILSILLIFLFVVAIDAWIKAIPVVPDQAALVIAPRGPIVEVTPDPDPNQVLQDALTGRQRNRPTTMKEVLDALDLAKDDSRIKTVVLNFDRFSGAGPSKLHRIGKAIDDFETSGKKVIAIGDNYGQAGYLIAAHASEVYIHPFGALLIQGYGSYRTYFGGLLNSFDVTRHLYKVSDYKSAADPFDRTEMSEMDKEQRREFLGDLWSEYQKDVEAARGLTAGTVAAYTSTGAQRMTEKKGDLAAIALDAGLVDGIKDRNESRAMLIELVGEDKKKKTFNQIGFKKYLAASRFESRKVKKDNRIAVVTAAGTIIDGEAPAGTTGGDTVARLIRKARKDEKVKAIVLRVDSGGGSAFASEVIRRELELAKSENGKKVVASFGSVAASGGYWISANTDRIYAPRTTITGSIGVVALLTSFDQTAEQFDVRADGVGTTPLSSFGNPLLPLNEDVKTIVRESFWKVYRDFLTIVSSGRKKTYEEVDAIAKGRVWSGVDAKEIGLIDEFGYLEDAIAGAAELAGIEDFETVHIQKKRTPMNALINEMTSMVTAWFVGEDPAPILPLPAHVKAMVEEANQMRDFNDPNGMHAVCLECRDFVIQ